MNDDKNQFPAQIRWVQRFSNFDLTFRQLQEPFATTQIESFNLLEQQGLITRFKLCFELAWKTLKDYLEQTGIVFELVVPREIIKQAYAAKIITDGQVWMEMLEDRNLLTHTYDGSVFVKTLHTIKSNYLPALEQLHSFLSSRSK